MMHGNVPHFFSSCNHSKVKYFRKILLQQLTPHIRPHAECVCTMCHRYAMYLICSITLNFLKSTARLWQLVCTLYRSLLPRTCGLSKTVKNRFETLYGEQNARLCRDHSILVDTARESRLLRVVTTLLTFGTSDTYVSRLNDIYVDHLVYTHQWQPFMKQSLKEWRSLSYLVSL